MESSLTLGHSKIVERVSAKLLCFFSKSVRKTLVVLTLYLRLLNIMVIILLGNQLIFMKLIMYEQVWRVRTSPVQADQKHSFLPSLSFQTIFCLDVISFFADSHLFFFYFFCQIFSSLKIYCQLIEFVVNFVEETRLEGNQRLLFLKFVKVAQQEDKKCLYCEFVRLKIGLR